MMGKFGFYSFRKHPMPKKGGGRISRPYLWLRACLILLILATPACSNRIVYDNADWWANWYIDDYVRFNRTQQRDVDRYLEQQLQWHRSTQLPRYEAFLLQAQKDFAGELTVPLVRARFEEIYQFWRDFVSEAMPASATMLAQLDQKQVDGFIASINREARAFEDEYADVTSEELAREHQQDTEKSLKKWIGPLTDKQQGIISQWAHAMKNVYPVSIKQRKHWQGDLELALRERENKALFELRLRKLFVTPSDSWNPEYTAMMDANELLTAQMVVDVHRTLTPKQRKHLFATLSSYVSDIGKLQKSR